MNLRTPWAVHTVRTVLALMLLGIGGSGLYFILSGTMPTVAGTTESIKAVDLGLKLSGIILVAKIVEIVTGLMLLLNFRPALATLLLAPITVGIMLYDLVLWYHVPAALIPAVVLLILNVYLGHVYWTKYRLIFTK